MPVPVAHVVRALAPAQHAELLASIAGALDMASREGSVSSSSGNILELLIGECAAQLRVDTRARRARLVALVVRAQPQIAGHESSRP